MKEKKTGFPSLEFYDLAAEAAEVLRGEANTEIPGVKEEITEIKGMRLSEITVLNEKGSAAMGRPPGIYTTLEAGELLSPEADKKPVIRTLSGVIRKMLPQKPRLSVLICGIGNPAISSDALGGKTTEHIIATRNLFSGEQEENDVSVALFTPNVLGNTGIESEEAVAALTKAIAPDVVFIVDALATSSFSRLATSFQITDTGLAPGGGIGNERPALNRATLGVPVIAMGVPTVIYPHAIVAEAFATLRELLPEEKKSTASRRWDAAEKRLYEQMDDPIRSFAVTPKDIDGVVADLSRILAGSIQVALHEEVTAENYREYTPL